VYLRGQYFKFQTYNLQIMSFMYAIREVFIGVRVTLHMNYTKLAII